jgi:hypothetical protein
MTPRLPTVEQIAHAWARWPGPPQSKRGCASTPSRVCGCPGQVALRSAALSG